LFCKIKNRIERIIRNEQRQESERSVRGKIGKEGRGRGRERKRERKRERRTEEKGKRE
jgi:hypothetical protein